MQNGAEVEGPGPEVASEWTSDARRSYGGRRARTERVRAPNRYVAMEEPVDVVTCRVGRSRAVSPILIVLVLAQVGCGPGGGDGDETSFDTAAEEQVDRVDTSGGIFTVRDGERTTEFSARVDGEATCGDFERAAAAGAPKLIVKLDGLEAGDYEVVSSLFGPGEQVAVVNLVGIDEETESTFTYPAVSGTVVLKQDVSGTGAPAEIDVEVDVPAGLLGEGPCSVASGDGGMGSGSSCECRRFAEDEIFTCDASDGAGSCCVRPNRIESTVTVRESATLSGCEPPN